MFVLFIIFLAIDAQSVGYAAYGKDYGVYKYPVDTAHKLEAKPFVYVAVIGVEFDVLFMLDGYHMLVTSLGIVDLQLMSVIHADLATYYNSIISISHFAQDFKEKMKFWLLFACKF